MDPAILAQQATEIIIPALSALCIAGKPVADKGKEVLVDMVYEKTFEKLSSAGVKKAKILLEKISPKMSVSLEKALIKVSENSEDPKAKEEFQQEILKLLRENPSLAREIELTINLNYLSVEQLAVGNYNNFFNIETPSGDEIIKIIEYLDQKRGDLRNKEITTLYSSSELPHYPERLKKFVIENRADELRKALVYLEIHRILLLSGVGGVGKSTLVRALIDLRPINVPEPFWFSFYDNQDAKLGDILEKLAAYMNVPEIASFKAERREPKKIDVDKLTDELYRRSCIWLIFDDLNIILEDQQFADKGIELLFSSLRFNTHNAKVIITSRILPIFENGKNFLDVIEDEEKHHLNGLKTEFAVDYLIQGGLDRIEHEKLEELAIGVDGHPLALKLLVELVEEFGSDDLLEDLNVYVKRKEDTIKKARRLFDKLAGNEKELLERISVYRKPMTMKSLKAMFVEKTPQDSVSKLLNKSLLETNHNGSYWLHSLVQEFAYKELKNKAEAHIDACKYYILLPISERPSRIEDLQSIIEANYHACSAGRFDVSARILYYSKLCDKLEVWGNFKTILELCTPLLPCISLGEQIIPIEYHEYFLRMLGAAYFKLGLTERAIIFFEEALKIARLRKDKRDELNALGNLGLAYQQFGDLEKSINYYEQAIIISNEIGDRSGEGNSYGNLGNAYLELGEIEKSTINYEKAVQILRNNEDKRGLANHLGNLGVLYSQIGKINESIDFFNQSLKLFKEYGDKIGEQNQLINMGIAYKNVGELEKSIEFYNKALEISIEKGDKISEADLLVNIGNLYLICKQPEVAIKHYQQSLKIDRIIGNKRGEISDFISLGISYTDLGQLEIAIEFYEKGLNFAKEMGIVRMEGIAQVNLGNTLFKLGRVERALNCFKEAFSIAKKINDPKMAEMCEIALNSKR